MIWCVKYNEKAEKIYIFDVEKLLSLADIKTVSNTQVISNQGMNVSEIDGVVAVQQGERRGMILQYNKIHADEH